MKRMTIKTATSVAVVLAVLLALAFSVQAAGNVPEKPGCQAEIEWDVTPEAKIESFSCESGKHKKDPALIFTVDLTNSSSKPLRFRLNVFLLDMDKAAGHLVPRKGKPPVVQPGKTETIKIPFIKTDKMSKKILVVVKTMK